MQLGATAVRSTPTNVAGALATPGPATVDIVADMVRTDHQEPTDGIADNQLRLTDRPLALERGVNSPVRVDPDAPSILLDWSPETAGMASAAFSAHILTYPGSERVNGTGVRVTGVLTTGDGPHAHRLAVSSLTSATRKDMRELDQVKHPWLYR